MLKPGAWSIFWIVHVGALEQRAGMEVEYLGLEPIWYACFAGRDLTQYATHSSLDLLLFILLFGKQRRREKVCGSENEHPSHSCVLICSPDAHSSWGWGSLKPAIRTQSRSLPGATWSHVLEPFSAACRCVLASSWI